MWFFVAFRVSVLKGYGSMSLLTMPKSPQFSLPAASEMFPVELDLQSKSWELDINGLIAVAKNLTNTATLSVNLRLSHVKSQNVLS